MLSKILTEKRKELGLSLQQAADRIGCTKPHLWELEKGRVKNPRGSLLRAIRDFYGISSDALLDGCP